MQRYNDPFLPKSTMESPYQSNFGRNFQNFSNGELAWRERGQNVLDGTVGQNNIVNINNSPMFKNAQMARAPQKQFIEGFSPLTGAPQQGIPRQKDLIDAPPNQMGFTSDYRSERRMVLLDGRESGPRKAVVEVDPARLAPQLDAMTSVAYSGDRLERSRYIVDTDNLYGGYTPFGNQTVAKPEQEHYKRAIPRNMQQSKIAGDLKPIVRQRTGTTEGIVNSRIEGFDTVSDYRVNNRKNIATVDNYARHVRGNPLNTRAAPMRQKQRSDNAIKSDNFTYYGNDTLPQQSLTRPRHISDPLSNLDPIHHYVPNKDVDINDLSHEKTRYNIKQESYTPVYYLGVTSSLTSNASQDINRNTVGNNHNKAINYRAIVSHNDNNGFYKTQGFTGNRQTLNTYDRAFSGSNAVAQDRSSIRKDAYTSNRQVQNTHYNRLDPMVYMK